MSTKHRSGYRGLPVIIRVSIYLGGNYCLIFLSQFIAGFLPFRGPIMINGLLCIFLLLFTKVILKLENMSFREIGGIPGNGKDVRQLVFGMLVGIMMLVVTAISIKILVGFHWELNKRFHWQTLITAFITVFCSVFAQELSFRGYPFRLLINKWGQWRAQMVIAILFGLMHLSSNMSIPAVLLTMLTTGLGSILFGMLVIRTERLHMAIGLHFGWNYVQLLLPRAWEQNGDGIWLVTGGNYKPELGSFLWITPYLAIITIAYFLLRRSFIRRMK